MIVDVLGNIIATDHIFFIHPIPEDFTIEDENDRLYFTVESITGNTIDIEGETLLEAAQKMFGKIPNRRISPNTAVYDYNALSSNQKQTALNTAVANLERVREKLIEYWNSNKFHIPKITL